MVRKDIVAHTRLDPRDRIRAIKGFICNVKESPDATAELKRWNLHIGTTIILFYIIIMPI